MEARDFIYHFTDILFSEIVRSTILTENWEEADFDYRYAEYADIFLRMKDSCLNFGQSDDEILKMLKNSKKTVVRNYNETMSKNFKEELIRNGTNPTIFDSMLSADILKEDEVNIHSLEQFRKFEERTFTQKPGVGV
jgi:hypothetical protein